jgi:ketosteroid isomerase-like protein
VVEAPPALPLEDRPHGGPAHDEAIDDYIKNLPKNAEDVRKNQAQVDAEGNKVGDNRPDVQWTDEEGRRHYVEVTSKTSRGNPDQIRANDPKGIIEIIDLEKGGPPTVIYP